MEALTVKSRRSLLKQTSDVVVVVIYTSNKRFLNVCQHEQGCHFTCNSRLRPCAATNVF